MGSIALYKGIKMRECKKQKECSNSKTYKPLLLWFVGFIAISTTIPIALERYCNISENALTKIILFLMVFSVDILMALIYKGEYVYWINGGPSYEEAKKAGREKCKKYAYAHLKIFLKISLLSIIYLIVSYIFHWNIWLDIVVISILIIIAAIMTIPIKFEND